MSQVTYQGTCRTVAGGTTATAVIVDYRRAGANAGELADGTWTIAAINSSGVANLTMEIGATATPITYQVRVNSHTVGYVTPIAADAGATKALPFGISG